MLTLPHSSPLQTRPLNQLLPGPGILLSRGLVYLVLALLTSTVGWAAWTRVDVVVVARGRIMVQDELVPITAHEAALVVDVAVEIGQHVSAGDLLLELDSFVHRNEAEKVIAEINVLKAQAQRSRDSAAEITNLQQSLVTEIDAMTQVVELSKNQRERTRKLLAQAVVTQSQMDEQEQQHLELQGRQARMAGELNRSRHDAAERWRQATDADERVKISEVLLAQLIELTQRASLRAPVAGTVTQLAVLHPGSVLNPATTAVTLQPDGQPLRACIEIPNASMRRLRPQLTARLELDAFPHADFGYLRGTLLEIDPDATADGNFRAWLSIDADELMKSQLTSQVKSGMQLQAQIVVEERDLLSFLLKPLDRLGEPIAVAE